MNGSGYKEIAESFSSGKFGDIESLLSDDIIWNMYEDKKIISGKQSVLDVIKKISNYSQSGNIKFEVFGILEEGDKVAIYGSTEFFRGSSSVNTVYTCDIYIFSPFGKIRKIHSYSNSNKPQINFGL